MAHDRNYWRRAAEVACDVKKKNDIRLHATAVTLVALLNFYTIVIFSHDISMPSQLPRLGLCFVMSSDYVASHHVQLRDSAHPSILELALNSAHSTYLYVHYKPRMFPLRPHNCRIHHVTASMTTIDLIIKPRTELLEPVTALFKLAAPSISSCALSIYISVSFYL